METYSNTHLINFQFCPLYSCFKYVWQKAKFCYKNWKFKKKTNILKLVFLEAMKDLLIITKSNIKKAIKKYNYFTNLMIIIISFSFLNSKNMLTCLFSFSKIKYKNKLLLI